MAPETCNAAPACRDVWTDGSVGGSPMSVHVMCMGGDADNSTSVSGVVASGPT